MKRGIGPFFGQDSMKISWPIDARAQSQRLLPPRVEPAIDARITAAASQSRTTDRALFLQCAVRELTVVSLEKLNLLPRIPVAGHFKVEERSGPGDQHQAGQGLQCGKEAQVAEWDDVASAQCGVGGE